ncbi:uncharacterized protein LOC130949289 [Arachis stenosperma]|uniref:uncharacterized protein LOC130949289 n=1 Tax=Arachis stenosperma TaxID=217475 RepID=UPI0025AC7E86|nr:uncharacterized protein LOC130949289 [Arachis stenosperma]
MVKEEWRGLGDAQFLDKLKALSKPLGRWHKKHFGNISEKIKRFEDEIKKVDDMVSNGVYDVNRLEIEEAQALEMLPSEEEVKVAVWDCKSFKAPGSDGKATSRFHITWVALAPKFVGAKEIKDLRPISKVGCIYKMISKVLTRRMRSVMPGLVGESQSAFVKGRRIHDGVLIACETVQWLKLKRKASAIIKLDFQKAYDRVK